MQGDKKLRDCTDGEICKKLYKLRTKRCLVCKNIKYEGNRQCKGPDGKPKCGSYYCSKHCHKIAWKQGIDPCKTEK